MGHARIRGSRGWVTARGHPAPRPSDLLKRPLSPLPTLSGEPERVAPAVVRNRMREVPLVVAQRTAVPAVVSSPMYLGPDWERSVRAFCAHYAAACSAMRLREYAQAYPGYLEAARRQPLCPVRSWRDV